MKNTAVTLADVRMALIRLDAKHGPPAVLAVLRRFGVTSVWDCDRVDPRHYAELVQLTTHYKKERKHA